MRYLQILLLSLFILSCNQDNCSEPNRNATIIGIGLDCGDLYIIQLDNPDSTLISNPENFYYLLNLDQQYKIPQLRVYVEYRNAHSNEIRPCTAFGPSYHQIFLENIQN